MAVPDAETDVPDAHAGEMTFQRELVCALGAFAGQTEAIMRRLKVFDSQATAVLERFG